MARLVPAKGKAVTLGRPERLLPAFSVYDSEKARFNADPDSVYSAYGCCFATCRDLENRFAVYRSTAPDQFQAVTIAFHKVPTMISSCTG